MMLGSRHPSCEKEDLKIMKKNKSQKNKIKIREQKELIELDHR